MSCRKLNLQNSANSDSSNVLNERKNREIYKLHKNHYDGSPTIPHFNKNELNKLTQIQYKKYLLWWKNRQGSCATNYFIPK